MIGQCFQVERRCPRLVHMNNGCSRLCAFERSLPHIFNLSEQGSTQALDRAEDGLGIGLALIQ